MTTSSAAGAEAVSAKTINIKSRSIHFPLQDASGPAGLQLDFDSDRLGFDGIKGNPVEAVHFSAIPGNSGDGLPSAAGLVKQAPGLRHTAMGVDAPLVPPKDLDG